MSDPLQQIPGQASALQAHADAFARDGFVVVRGFCPPPVWERIRVEVLDALDPLLGPAEFEAELGYPGAPASRDASGGDTPRRLLHAYSRFPALRELVTGDRIRGYTQRLLGTETAYLSQCHHNCVMTKYPRFSSDTLWHQDVRYWSFQRPELVSFWLALGDEHERNGALKVIPGTHRQTFAADQLDTALFLRTEAPANRDLIAAASTVTLAAGDALFFHCRTFHAAGRNETDQVKLSAVFTYYGGDNGPVSGSRSARYPGIRV
ncbi:MAG: phytanoyl-CoA dioxygenase family protein [Pseudomonadales bacterium]